MLTRRHDAMLTRRHDAMLTRRRAISLVPALAVLRCAGPLPPPTLEFALIGGADQNPDPAGHPTAVEMRLYQLAAAGAFAAADVFALTDHAAATLGADLLATEAFVLAPGERLPAKGWMTRDLRPGARLLGAAVLFRDIDRAAWRASASLAPSGPTRLVLRTAAISATLAPG